MDELIDVPVIVVGGGGCGLTCSSFLSDYGVEHFLFERRAGSSGLPKAQYLNQRTMETLRVHDLKDEIVKSGSPPENMSLVAWGTSLGGDGLVDRKIIHQFACFGANDGSPRAAMYR